LNLTDKLEFVCEVRGAKCEVWKLNTVRKTALKAHFPHPTSHFDKFQSFAHIFIDIFEYLYYYINIFFKGLNNLDIYKCDICGYVYDESKESVKFEDLPDNWVCPICGVGKDSFSKE